MKSRSYVALFLVLALVLAAMLTGCGSSSSEAEVPANGEAQETTQGDTAAAEVKDSIVIGIDQEPAMLDALGKNEQVARQVFANVYESLTTYEDGQAKPGIAKDWTISEDKLEYTFNLNEGYMFHNGEELKGSDAAFSIQRGMDSSYVQLFFNMIESVEEVGEYAIKIRLKRPTPTFLQIVSLPQTSIGSEKAFIDGGEDYGRSAIGCGPYEFVEWVSGDRIVLKAFEGYHGDQPAIKDVTYRIITDKGTGMIALEKGEIDAYIGLSFVDAANADNNPDLVYDEGQVIAFEQLVINNEDEMFSNQLIRQAISYAIDKESVLIAGRDGKGQVADCRVPSGMFGYTEDTEHYDYNPEKAKELLAQAGYPDGFDTRIIVNAGYREKESQVIQANLNDVGINLTIDVYEWGALLDMVYEGEYSLALAAKSMQINDPGLIVPTIYNSENIGRGGNYFRFASEEADQYIAIVTNELDTQLREEAYHKLFKILAEEVPNVPLYWRNENVGYTKGLQGLKVNPEQLYRVKDLSWE